MRKRKKRTDNIDIPVTPLIDIVFLLLIYFLLTSHFIKQQFIKVDLPESKTKSNYVEKKLLTISITKEGSIYLDGKPIERNKLKEALSLAKREGIEQIIIEADRNARVQILVSVMDLVKASGFEKVMLKTIEISGAS